MGGMGRVCGSHQHTCLWQMPAGSILSPLATAAIISGRGCGGVMGTAMLLRPDQPTRPHEAKSIMGTAPGVANVVPVRVKIAAKRVLFDT